MATTVHFMDVGQGNMTLLQLADGRVFLYDCNVTEDNEESVLAYLATEIGEGTKVNVFVCSHRDADHMRGVKKIDARFPIQRVWDSGATGTTTNSSEYLDYMELRRRVGFTEVQARRRYDYGSSRLRVMNSTSDELAGDPNAQSIVIKVEHRDVSKDVTQASVLLCGDTDAVTWQHIRTLYSDSDLSCSLLLGSHHGAITFFDDPDDEQNYYTSHIKAMAPAMTILSVGDNAHGHPHPKAVKLYEKYSSGSNKGNKLYRTDIQGNICVVLKDGGGWNITKNR
ncbi:MAG: MBL fold metallo-hydrolase [Roseiarcus sp.]|jgi:beta-lactamase superfamily II metal-dependent hydrolase